MKSIVMAESHATGRPFVSRTMTGRKEWRGIIPKISPENRLTLIHGGLKMAWYDGVIVRWSGLTAGILRWPISSVPTSLAELAPYFQLFACPTPPIQHEQKKSLACKS